MGLKLKMQSHIEGEGEGHHDQLNSKTLCLPIGSQMKLPGLSDNHVTYPVVASMIFVGS